MKTLLLQNFRNHKDTTIETNAVNWFIGRSGSGKSAIPMAIETALTCGLNEATNDRGTGIDFLIMDGAEGESLVRVVGNNGDCWEYNLSTHKAYGPPAPVNVRTIRACLRARYILGLDDGEQKKLLSDVLVDEMSEEQLIAALNTWTPESPGLGDWLQKAGHLSKADNYKATKDRNSSWNYAYDMRSAANQTVKAMQALHAPDLQDIAVDVVVGHANPEAAAIEARATEFERAREVWRRKYGRAPADRNERARQTRFMLSRGFGADIVNRIFRSEDDQEQR